MGAGEQGGVAGKRGFQYPHLGGGSRPVLPLDRFGYLHRDGRISSRLKGNMWKGPFHIPRMQWYCWKLLEG